MSEFGKILMKINVELKMRCFEYKIQLTRNKYCENILLKIKNIKKIKNKYLNKNMWNEYLKIFFIFNLHKYLKKKHKNLFFLSKALPGVIIINKNSYIRIFYIISWNFG